MANPEEINADQLAFWNGAGGRTWVSRQEHTDLTLAAVSQALHELAAPQLGESVLDIGCGCGACTIEFARAVGPDGRVVALDISGPMLAEGARRAADAGVTNIDWRQADAGAAPLEPYDLLVSNFGLMFFGNPVAAFTHLRAAANRGARMAFVCWRSLEENPWMEVPRQAVAPHLPPRAPATPNSPGMFAFAQPDRMSEILTASGWASPSVTKLDVDLDIAAGRGLEEAIVQTTQIGAINSWLRNQSEEIVAASVESLRRDLGAHAVGASVHLPAAMWLVTSEPV